MTADLPDRAVLPPAHPRGSRAITVSSRAGVWGLVVALLPPLAEAFGVRFAPGLYTALASSGLLVSGAGTVVASALVWRSLPRKLSPLKLASLVGLPFGSVLILGGLAILDPLSSFAGAVASLDVLVLALAVTVVALLVIGFVSGRDDG